MPSTRIEIISDAIVRVRPQKVCTLTKMSELFDELIVLKEIIADCISHGIFVRGAMTIGSMYLDDDPAGPLFGPALVDAYQLESREVIYPRVAVSDEVLMGRGNTSDPFQAEVHRVDTEMAALILTRDGSGLHFIDYLRAIITDVNHTEEEVIAFLERHRSLISSGLRTHRADVRRKYLWLQNYHNMCIESTLNEGCASPNDLKQLSTADWQILLVKN